MASIETINVRGEKYDIAATYDSAGNDISTYNTRITALENSGSGVTFSTLTSNLTALGGSITMSAGSGYYVYLITFRSTSVYYSHTTVMLTDDDFPAYIGVPMFATLAGGTSSWAKFTITRSSSTGTWTIVREDSSSAVPFTIHVTRIKQ